MMKKIKTLTANQNLIFKKLELETPGFADSKMAEIYLKNFAKQFYL